MDSSQRELRIACVQFEPTFKDVKASIKTAESLIEKLLPNQLDILCFPEMALTGYCFESLDEILPFLEIAESGPTFVWSSQVAKRLNCYILIGFPQIQTNPTSSTPIYSNSLLIISPLGELHSVYQKQFLYETDESWCTEPNPSFKFYDLEFPTSSPFYVSSPTTIDTLTTTTTTEMSRVSTFRIAPSICMDLSNWKFISPFEAFELTTFAKENEVDILVCCMNWLDSNQAEEEEPKEELDSWDEVKSTLNYWALRCTPLMKGKEKAIFVACNRIGTERGVRFTGSSCIIKFQTTSPEVHIHASKKGAEVIMAKVKIG